MRPTYEEVIASRRLTAEALAKEFAALKKKEAGPTRSMTGNKILYHYQMDVLCRTSREGHKSLYEKMTTPVLYDRLWRDTMKMDRTGLMTTRVFEMHRFNGCIAFFKPMTAKWLYQRFGATKVLDPTAGWGGRMLAAWALGIQYTGIDTNLALKPGYDDMMAHMGDPGLRMIWQSCLEVDFSAIDYDFVLTSPPYINLEHYEHMPAFESKAAFYQEFLIPLISKCLAHIRPGGHVAINISTKMYDDLMVAGFAPCHEDLPFVQQKKLGRDMGDRVYVWRRPPQ